MKSLSQADTTPGPSHATVFVWLFAVASIWHYTSSASQILESWFRFHPVDTPLTALSVLTAFIAALFPQRTSAVLLFSAGQFAAIFIRMPFVADHLVMELVLHCGILCSYGYLAIRQRTLRVSTDDMFALYSPVGRWLLIIMYFYGTFHKFNPGFMSLDSSCAIPFIDGFPIIGGLLDHPLPQYAAIYGTLILEALAMLLLLSSRTKYFGMLLGMGFHFVIGISTYGTLAHFSAFALASHTLFLPSGFGKRVHADALVPGFLRSREAVKGLTIAVVGLQVLLALHLALTGQGYLVNTLFAVFAVILMTLVFKHGQPQQGDTPYRLVSPLRVMHVLPVLYFLYCASPYVGLGTGGSLAMFSGLRTEGGISNHYVITEPGRLFSYQDRIVYIESASNTSLQAAADEGQGVILFDFQRHFTSREQLVLPLTVIVDGERFVIDDGESLSAFANRFFSEQSWLARKAMSFRLVDDVKPRQCRH